MATRKSQRTPAAARVTAGENGTLVLDQPQFAHPTTTPDPKKFTVAHGNDNPLYKLVQKKLLQAIPNPRPDADLTMDLAEVLGSGGAATVAAIQKAGQIVFHSLGDSGSIKGPESQSLVTDKLV